MTTERKDASSYLPIVGLMALFVIVPVVGGVWAVQPIDVELTKDALVVHSVRYGRAFPRPEIKGIERLDRLPPIRKIRGYSMGGSLRGQFQVEGLGAGLVFAERRRPPFIVVHHQDGFVVFNLDRPGATEALYEELKPQLSRPSEP